MLQSSKHMCKKQPLPRNNGKHVLAKELWNTETPLKTRWTCWAPPSRQALPNTETEVTWWNLESDEFLIVQKNSVQSSLPRAWPALNLNLLNQIIRSLVYFLNALSWTWAEFNLSHFWRSRLFFKVQIWETALGWWRYKNVEFLLKSIACSTTVYPSMLTTF